MLTVYTLVAGSENIILTFGLKCDIVSEFHERRNNNL